MSVVKQVSASASVESLVAIAREACVEWTRKSSSGYVEERDLKDLKVAQLARVIGQSYGEKSLDFLIKSPRLVLEVIEDALQAGAVFSRTTANGLFYSLQKCQEQSKVEKGKVDVQKEITLVGRQGQKITVQQAGFFLLFHEYKKVMQNFKGKAFEDIHAPLLSLESMCNLKKFIDTGRLGNVSFESALELVYLCDMLDPLKKEETDENLLLKEVLTIVNKNLETEILSPGCKTRWIIEFLLHYFPGRSVGDKSLWDREIQGFFDLIGDELKHGFMGFVKALEILHLSPEVFVLLDRPIMISPSLLDTLLHERSMAGVAFRASSPSHPVRVEISSNDDKALLLMLLEQNPDLFRCLDSVVDTGMVIPRTPEWIDLAMPGLLFPENVFPLVNSSFGVAVYQVSFYRYVPQKNGEGDVVFLRKTSEDALAFSKKTGIKDFVCDVVDSRGILERRNRSPGSRDPTAEELAVARAIFDARVLFEDPFNKESWDSIKEQASRKVRGPK